MKTSHLRVPTAVALLLSAPCYAEKHEHGVGGVPDWYDSSCCNNKDCSPVEDDEISFGLDNVNNPIVIFTRGQLHVEYDKSRWRTSQDERYHVCRNNNVPYCVYIRGGF